MGRHGRGVQLLGRVGDDGRAALKGARQRHPRIVGLDDPLEEANQSQQEIGEEHGLSSAA